MENDSPVTLIVRLCPGCFPLKKKTLKKYLKKFEKTVDKLFDAWYYKQAVADTTENNTEP